MVTLFLLFARTLRRSICLEHGFHGPIPFSDLDDAGILQLSSKILRDMGIKW